MSLVEDWAKADEVITVATSTKVKLRIMFFIWFFLFCELFLDSKTAF
jgi:hypothetical protein